LLQLSFVNYTANSFVLIEGTPATDRFFIIQSGKVRCYHETQIPGRTQDILGPGDFVGVISCMTGFSQTENVVAMTNVTAIAVRRDQYPELIMQNPAIAMKIVRYFAQTMRSLNDNLASITSKADINDTPEHLFSVGDYYEKADLSDVAQYCYYQYLKECPNGSSREVVNKRYEVLKLRSHAVYLEPTSEMTRSYPANSMIFAECQKGSDMFIIQEGEVKISKINGESEVTFAILRKGDMFGEMALLENKPRSASAIAIQNVKVMVVNRANFDMMVSTQPQMIARLTTTLAERLWAMYRQLGNTQLKDIRERLVDMLALQVEKAKIPMMKDSAYATNLTPMELINLCGLQQEDYGVAINKLQMDQNVKLIAGKIVVPDVINLVKQATFYRKQNIRHLNEK